MKKNKDNMAEKNAVKRTGKKLRMIAIVVFIIIVVVGVVVVSGFENNQIESEIRHLKDEASMYKYNTSMLVDKVWYEFLDAKEVKKEDKIIVCIDPGHGGSDPGTMAGKIMEKEQNLKFAKRIRKNLKKYGVEVIMTRETDEDVSLKERTDMANSMEADLYVSLHRNYLNGYPSVNGIDVYINFEGTEADYVIGNALCNNLSKIKGMKVNELKLGSATDAKENYTVVQDTDMTACLVEMGYMSNYMDNVYFEDYFKSYSIAVAEAIWEYLQYDLSLKTQTVD